MMKKINLKILLLLLFTISAFTFNYKQVFAYKYSIGGLNTGGRSFPTYHPPSGGGGGAPSGP